MTKFEAWSEAQKVASAATKSIRDAMLAHWTDESMTEEREGSGPETLKTWVDANKAAQVADGALQAAKRECDEETAARARKGRAQERRNDR